jgi:uroporphyrinogen decarboxylase
MTTRPAMTPMQRVLAALAHQEPDQVPVFLPVTLHGARELNLSIRDYFSEARYVAEGQLRMRAKFRHDCLYAFFYAALEVEAWGGEVIYREDGPASSGEPFIRRL